MKRQIVKVILLVACLLPFYGMPCGASPFRAGTSPSESVFRHDCGSSFKVESVTRNGQSAVGESGGEIDRLSNPFPIEDLEMGRIREYNLFCNEDDQGLLAACNQKHKEAAFNNAAETCKNIGITNALDETQHICKKDTCEPDEPGCITRIKDAVTGCTLGIAAINSICSCSIKKGIQPRVGHYPYGYGTCNCHCECEFVGTVEARCSNCEEEPNED